MRLPSAVLVLAVVLLGSVFVGIGAAQDDDPAPHFEGVLEDEGIPVADVTILVREIDGEFTSSAVSEVDGSWRVELPRRGGVYEIELDVATLPAGVELSLGETAVLRTRISQPGQVRILTFSLGEAESLGTSTATQVAQAAVNGVKFGLIIAMSSIGLSLIFGTTGLINFSHGELVTFGAALAWWLNVETIEVALLVAAVIAVIGGGALGGVLEKGMMARLRVRRLGSFQFVVVTIGLSLIGRQLIQMWIGEGNQSFREYQIQKPWELGPIDLTPRDATIIVVSIVMLVAVASVLQFTRMGKAMRAVSDNPSLAASSGIAVDRVILSVWVAGAGLAALGGVFFGLSEIVKFDMGFRLLLLIFAAVVLGGLGTAYGAMVGGLMIGLVTEISTVWVQPELKFVWALLALVIVLLVRPQGILGARERVG